MKEKENRRKKKERKISRNKNISKKRYGKEDKLACV